MLLSRVEPERGNEAWNAILGATQGSVR